MLRIGIYYFWTQSQRVRAREFETGPSAAFTSILKVGMILPSIQQVLIVILIRLRIGLFVINICIFHFCIYLKTSDKSFQIETIKS